MINIDPSTLYFETDFRISGDLTANALSKARKEGKLRHCRPGSEFAYMGQWLLDWPEAISQGGQPRPDGGESS